MAGKIAGHVCKKDGRLEIGIDYKTFYGHVVAWVLMTGRWPSKGIDHINGDPSDNRWINLRLCSQPQNCGNSKRHSDRKSNFAKGVYFRDGLTRPFYARICINYCTKYLGYFASEVEAAEAYKAAAIKHFGEFARTE